MAALARFGASRARELKDEQKADFIAYCVEILTGAAKPLESQQ